MRRLFLAACICCLTSAAAAQSLDDARERLRVGSYAEARATLEALVRDGGLAGARIDLARLHLLLGDVEAAEAVLAPLFAEGERPPLDARVARAEVLVERGDYTAGLLELDAVVSEASGPVFAARLARGDLRRTVGDLAGARDDYDWLIARYQEGVLLEGADIGLAGVAFRRVGSYQAANDAFAAAIAADDGQIDARLAWAELFLEKYRPDQAAEIVVEALDRNPSSPRALALLARARFGLARDPSSAIRLAEEALSLNPHLPEAHELLAEIALGDEEYPRALERVATVLERNPRRLRSLTLAAAAHFLLDRQEGYAELAARTLAVNPEHADFYSEIADFVSHALRHGEARALYEQALAIDPESSRALLGLGLLLTRDGDDERGVAYLRRAFENDPFNVRAFHLVRLFEEQLAEYETFESQHFRFRVHHSERRVLEAYLPELAEAIFAWLSSRYEVEPEVPISIELFADAETFAVRSVGLPHVAPHGICFGRVITGRSPSEGTFNWAEVLTHELSHVFTLAQSRARVPRWFTEGLADYDTESYRPEWRREGELALLARLSAGELPSLAHLNQAFVRSENPAEVMAAYSQSNLTVRFIAERWGRGALLRMLDGFSTHQRLPEVLANATELTVAAFDEAFEEYVHTELSALVGSFEPTLTALAADAILESRVAAAPESARAHAELALARFRARRIDECQQAYLRALELDPSEPLANFLAGTFALRERRFGTARERFETVLRAGLDGYTLRTELAYLERQAGNHSQALEHLERATAIYPRGLVASRDLAELRVREGDPARARAAIERVAQIDQGDAAVRLQLLRLDLAAGDIDAALRSCQHAIEVAPFAAEVHVDCGRAALAAGERDALLRELELAELLGATEQQLAPLREAAAGL